MKTTIIYDNTAFRRDLQADALVESKGKRILFDTGRILLSNMRKLVIVPKDIDEVFILILITLAAYPLSLIRTMKLRYVFLVLSVEVKTQKKLLK